MRSFLPNIMGLNGNKTVVYSFTMKFQKEQQNLIQYLVQEKEDAFCEHADSLQ